MGRRTNSRGTFLGSADFAYETLERRGEVVCYESGRNLLMFMVLSQTDL